MLDWFYTFFLAIALSFNGGRTICYWNPVTGNVVTANFDHNWWQKGLVDVVVRHPDGTVEYQWR